MLVVTRSQEPEAQEGGTWYRQNEVSLHKPQENYSNDSKSYFSKSAIAFFFKLQVTLVVSFISILYPNLFDMIGITERYHPRVQLRWQLAR